jgi:hypothetical protein
MTPDSRLSNLASLGLLGGALLIAYFGAGPFSFDERAEQPAREAASPKAAMYGSARRRGGF